MIFGLPRIVPVAGFVVAVLAAFAVFWPDGDSDVIRLKDASIAELRRDLEALKEEQRRRDLGYKASIDALGRMAQRREEDVAKLEQNVNQVRNAKNTDRDGDVADVVRATLERLRALERDRDQNGLSGSALDSLRGDIEALEASEPTEYRRYNPSGHR